jgi:hypothetical protein
MKAVSLYAVLADLARKWNQLRNFRLASMEARIKTGNLRDIGQPFADGLNRGQIVWLMQGGQRCQPMEFDEDFRRNDHGILKERTAVNNPVANS